MNWLLPEHIADALPHEAARIERLRRTVLDLFRGHGYEYVIPPMLEYLDSLLTGTGSDLDLRTFKLVDQLTGRTLGLRADITPQVTRIDAHLLNRQGVTRLCYCDSVLHTLPASITASRELIQIGAEIYGYSGIDADIEIIRLMDKALKAAGTPASRIDISHVGVFRALAVAAKLDEDSERKVLQQLQTKDMSGLQEACATVEEPFRSALMSLPALYGGIEALELARSKLPALPEIHSALHTLETLQRALPQLPLSFDLADLRGYNYHNGVVFDAYFKGYSSAVAQGGRYDGVGRSFGRARPATGFSMDLRSIAALAEDENITGTILAPFAPGDTDLKAAVDTLREAGRIVVELLPGEIRGDELPCAGQLVQGKEGWIIQAINED